jgi:hypothetical protein
LSSGKPKVPGVSVNRKIVDSRMIIRWLASSSLEATTTDAIENSSRKYVNKEKHFMLFVVVVIYSLLIEIVATY